MVEEKSPELLDYSIYLLDARGRVQAAQRLRAASDECALWKLTNLDFLHTAELWRRGRRIAAIEAPRRQG